MADNKRLQKLKDKSDKTKNKAQKARQKSEKCLTKKGKVKGVGIPNKISRGAIHVISKAAHDKAAESIDDDYAGDAILKGERIIEKSVSAAGYVKRKSAQHKVNKAEKLEKQHINVETKYRQEKYFEKNSETKTRNRNAQKKRIKREYANEYRKGFKNATKNTNKFFENTGKSIEFVKNHPLVALAGAGLFILMIFLVSGLSSCVGMMSGSVSNVMYGTYQSEPDEIDAAENSLSLKEMQLQNTIDNIETDNPGYDEYTYTLDEIGHNPYVLISYLSAVNIEFRAADIENQIQEIFDEMYTLTCTPRTETRTRCVMKHRTEYDIYGNPHVVTYSDTETYTVTILDVKLVTKSIDSIASEKLNEDDLELYNYYNTTQGALQDYETPLDFDWQSMVSSGYGYRKNPITGQNEFNRGIDIAVPEGTQVYASQGGTVDTAGYDPEYGNYIVISNSEGFESKYSHLSSINVTVGQTVCDGDMIGLTGSTGSITGSQLHFECLHNGEYYNPMFYVNNGNGSIYGETDAINGANAGEIIEEAERYLGYPYVWGASSPSTGFDCSGFVCYVYTHSGHNLPRTSAQQIYNKCDRISPEEAQPGDLIFFTGTYASGSPVSHIGIYAGDGKMIHAGKPVKYSSVNTPYWQSHFYAYGRLRS